MTWILWLNTVAEAALAVGMFTMPASFFPGANDVAASIARTFAFALLAVAFISFSISGRRTSHETLKTGVWILLFYHVTQLIAQLLKGVLFPPVLIPPVVIHTVFSVLFIAYARKLAADESKVVSSPTAARS